MFAPARSLDCARDINGVREVGWRGYVGGISFPRDCHASLAMTRRYGCALGLIILILIKRPTRPNSLSFRGNGVTVGIALARRGGTNCRKNSPQVTVFSQSGPTMLRAGSGNGCLGDRRAQSLRGRVFGVFVYGCSRLYRRGFLD